MFERPQGGERAGIVQVDIARATDLDAFNEFRLLAQAAGADILWEGAFTRFEPSSKYFIGSGQAEEIAYQVEEHQLELVILNVALTPSQERNLEKLLKTRVLDRTGLVLDIFAQRAQSHEGKLQVELAQLSHLSTRLVRGWTHLERQKGGIGLRGPGETQLETDRRLLAERIKMLKRRLAKVDAQRQEKRKNRARNHVSTVALAGYTNSGKSTLFNQLTDAQVLAKDQLFATLDPTCRRLKNASKNIVLSDTVGFVSDLPHELVKAFHSTLEETIFADLIVHVIDRADPNYQEHEAVVEAVLKEIGADHVPRIKVYNKIDKLEGDEQTPKIQRNLQGVVQSVFISALHDLGMPLLLEAIEEFFAKDHMQGYLHLSLKDSGLRAQLYALHAVREETILDDGSYQLYIDIDKKFLQQLQSRYNRQLQLQS